MNKFIKYPLIFIGVVATIGIVGFGVLQVYWTMNSQDESVPDDSDLIPVITEVPDEENAYFDIIKAQDALVWPNEETETNKIEKILKGEEWDEEFVVELLEKNKTALDHFKKVSTYAKFRDIKIPNNINDWDYNMVLTGLSGIRNVAKLTSIESQYLFMNGQEKEAIDLSIKILKNGQLIQDSGSTIGYLIGIAIKGYGTERIKAISWKNSLKSDELMKYITALESFTNNENGLSIMWKGEYTAVINSLEKINNILREGGNERDINAEIFGIEGNEIDGLFSVDKKFTSAYHYKPNQTRRIFSENVRTLIDSANKNCSDAYVFEREYYPELYNIFFTENAVGKTLAGIWVISLQSINNKKCTEDANIIEAQLMLVVKAYEQDKSKKPDKLEDLVPNYISEIPVDPFTGNPVEYSPEKEIIINKEAPNKEN